jgi:hypothetical protein
MPLRNFHRLTGGLRPNRVSAPFDEPYIGGSFRFVQCNINMEAMRLMQCWPSLSVTADVEEFAGGDPRRPPTGA